MMRSCLYHICSPFLKLYSHSPFPRFLSPSLSPATYSTHSISTLTTPRSYAHFPRVSIAFPTERKHHNKPTQPNNLRTAINLSNYVPHMLTTPCTAYMSQNVDLRPNGNENKVDTSPYMPVVNIVAWATASHPVHRTNRLGGGTPIASKQKPTKTS